MNVAFDPERSAAIEAALAEEVRLHTKRPQFRRSHQKWLIGGAVLAGAAFSIAASAVIVGGPGWIALPGTDSSAQPSYAAMPDWPKNANGQSYGQQGSSPVAPDLIEVQGEDVSGLPVDGYVLAEDLVRAQNGGPTPTSPAQALEQQEERLEKYPNGQWLPVYTSDGQTQIGRFLVASGN